MQDIEILELEVPQQPLAGTSSVPPMFAPHRAINLDGVLCCAQRTERRREQLAGIILKELTELVAQVVLWSVGSADADRHVGDTRFLVITLNTGSGTDAYVQIWYAGFRVELSSPPGALATLAIPHTTTPRLNCFAIAHRHHRSLASPRLHYGREIDVERQHILRRSHPNRVPTLLSVEAASSVRWAQRFPDNPRGRDATLL